MNRETDENGFPIMRGERRIRFACGLIAGLLAGCQLAPRFGASGAGTAFLMAATGLAFGFAAALLGDRFWARTRVVMGMASFQAWRRGLQGCIAVVGLIVTGFACASGASGERGVTCGARKVKLTRARKISLDMTLGQIESLLGPPERDVGSGRFVLEWSCTDGTRIHVSAAPDLPTTKPVAVTFESAK